MDSYYREYEFSLSSILSFVWRGIVVGCVSGIVVSLFRLLIGFISAKVVNYYELSHEQPSLLILILGMTLFIVVAIGFLIKSDSDIKGSGIPHVEGELKGLLHPDWWSVLWKKFVGGVLAISMGFMLGREGPSIQLGAMAGKGVAQSLKAERMEKRVLIASGAAAGLSAAFNAPIAGLLFVIEEIYHQFSRLVWITALVASLVANFISLNIFGLTPVLDMPGDLAVLPLKHYWILLLLGAFLGVMGYIYEKTTLKATIIYDFLGKVFHISNYFYGIFAAILIFANRLFLSAIARWWKWLDYFIIDKSPDSYDCFHILYHSLCVEYVELLKWTSWWDFSSYFDFGSTFRLWFWNIF